MTKSKIALIVSTSILAVGVIVMTTLFILSSVSQNRYKKELSSMYMKNMYDFVDGVGDLEVNLSKLMATSSLETQRELLNDIYVDTTSLGTHISNLPISQIKTENVMELINRLGGFSYSLLTNTYDDKEISSEDYKQLETLYSSTRSLLYDINEYLKTTRNRYDILKYVDFKDGENSSFNAGVHTNESSVSKLPSLIYDGPFSDSVLNKEIKGLKDIDYTKEDADKMLKDIYKDSSIIYTGDSDGLFATYNYTIDNGNKLYVSVTKKGGMLLNITGYAAKGNVNYSVDDGIMIAENFANIVGFDNMYSVWTLNSDSVLYVNLAPILNQVIYYPDLVKVKVDLVSGNVIGLDATNYAYNHVDRPEYKTTTSILQGDDYLNDRLKVVERNYAVIPNKYVGESMAYEYICKWENYTYYIYLDVNTFKELQILRVVDTTSGGLIE